MRVGVVSSWYPDRYSAYSGVFVRKQVEAVEALGADVWVENPEIYPAPPGNVPPEIWDAMRRLAKRDPNAVFDTLGRVTKVPAPVPSRSGYLGRAEAFIKALAMKREFIPLEVDVVHAHLGIPTGLALIELGDRPLVVTEHQSTLERMLAEAGAVEKYRKVIATADSFICVSNHLRDRILAVCGDDLADQIEVVPNIVDLSDISFRSREEPRVSNWIYVGTIAQHKGVELLVKAFDMYRKNDRDGHLTIVGDGPHRPWVERYASGRGFRASLTLTGSVPHSAIGEYLSQADVMVHLSPSETFGIASLEGIGAGLPVVSLQNGGAEDAWGDFENEVGILLAPDAGAEQVAEAVQSVQRDGNGLDLARARRRVLERFSAETVGAELWSIYQRVL